MNGDEYTMRTQTHRARLDTTPNALSVAPRELPPSALAHGEEPRS